MRQYNVEHSDAQSDQKENIKNQNREKEMMIEKDSNEKQDENTGNDTNQCQL